MKFRPRGGFSLVELLTVLLLISICAGMVVMLPRGYQRRGAVEGAANELAETMRLAHNLALHHRAIYALVFNITNAPGTSGLVINNWSGGHWYQILGPNDSPLTLNLSFNYAQNLNGEPMCPYPYFNSANNENLSSFLAGVHSSWVGDRHFLPARKVRFLALTDQDNGGYTISNVTPNYSGFSATYPRFWFGWYDNSTHKLRPWGGYDPTVPGRNMRKGPIPHSSGFFFEGGEGTITGCINPTTRIATDATSSFAMTGNAAELLHAGMPRPLVNGDWMDYAIIFLPDGTIHRYHFDAPRLLSYTYGSPDLLQFGVGVQSPVTESAALKATLNTNSANENVPYAADPATNFYDRTGRLFITLAPDVDQDTDQFGDVTAAYNSIMPAYRVSISAIGAVDVLPVHNTLVPGTTLDTTITNWQTQASTDVYYQNNELTNSDGSPRGQPIIDRLTPTMLTTPQCWSNP